MSERVAPSIHQIPFKAPADVKHAYVDGFKDGQDHRDDEVENLRSGKQHLLDIAAQLEAEGNELRVEVLRLKVSNDNLREDGTERDGEIRRLKENLRLATRTQVSL